MSPKVFLTGVTGYIGGDAFFALHQAHPDYDYTLLVRNEDKGKVVSAAYPDVRLVYGPLEDAELLAREVAAADIVVHTADSSDHCPAAAAIVKGALEGHSADRPLHWIHICGTSILQWYDQEHKRYGEAPLAHEKYDDLVDIDRVLNLPDRAEHRDCDKIVLAAATAHPTIVKPAIVGPPTIYGRGRGPGNTRSKQVYNLTAVTLAEGAAPVIGAGLAEWDNVHVHDLSAFLTRLAEATQEQSFRDDPDVFGPRAYFFLEHASHRWGDVARWVADEAHKRGLIPAAEHGTAGGGSGGGGRLAHTTMEAYCAARGATTSTFGLNSKSVASRARKYFGWTPKGRSLRDEIPNIVTLEAKTLGK